MTDSGEPFVHWCEVCGKTEVLTSEKAYRKGWDFPPRMGAWGVISPRTCNACPTNQTVWWAVQMDGCDAEQLSAHQHEVAARIVAEGADGKGRAQLPAPDPARPDRLDVDAGGSWVVSTQSGSHYLLQLDGDERMVSRLAVDDRHVHSDGAHPLRRDGETLPLLGLVDPPIQVGRPAYLVIGKVTDEPGYVSTTRATTPVVEIRRVD